MSDQREKFERLKTLHSRGHASVIPNPWDAGSARLLASLGFEALATTSAGYAFSKGKRDSFAGLGRSEILENAAEIVGATTLPVSADLEDGFGVAPETCAETIRMACTTGLVGGSIEDATGNPDAPIYDISQSVERIRAAAEAARNLPFLLTARAENYLWGRPDLGDTIKRLQAFAEAGADVLYAPGLPDIEAIRTVCRAVDKPVQARDSRGGVFRPGRSRRPATCSGGSEGIRHLHLCCGRDSGHRCEPAHVAGPTRRQAAVEPVQFVEATRSRKKKPRAMAGLPS